MAIIWGCGIIPFRSNTADKAVMSLIEAETKLLADKIQSGGSGAPEVIFALLEDHLKKNPDVFGAALATAPLPGSPGKTDGYYVYRDNGRLVRKTDRGYDFENSPGGAWYLKPYREKRALWSEPYKDVDGAGRDIRMITYTLPVYERGDSSKLAFMVTGDLRLK